MSKDIELTAFNESLSRIMLPIEYSDNWLAKHVAKFYDITISDF